MLVYKALVGGGASVPFPPTEEEATHALHQRYILRQSQERFGKPCGEIFAHLDQQAKKCIRKRDITTKLFQQRGILQTLIIDSLHGDPAQRLSMEQIKERLHQYQARC